MAEIWKAEQSIVNQVNDLIANYHPEIATASIAVLFKEAATAGELESGQVCITKKITGLSKALSADDVDFAIVIAADIFSSLSDTQQTAMLDSALTSCTVKLDESGDFKVDKSGNPIWTIKPHDIVAHASIIQRYGLEVLRDAGDSIRAYVEQSSTKSNSDEYDDVPVAKKPRRKKEEQMDG